MSVFDVFAVFDRPIGSVLPTAKPFVGKEKSLSYAQVVAPQQGIPVAPQAKRPGSLLAMMVTAALSALTGLVGSGIVFLGGRELADENVLTVGVEHPDVLGLPAGLEIEDLKSLAGPLWDAMIDERADSMAARAAMVVFCGVLLLVFALLARKGATWARVLVGIFAVVAWVPHFLILSDYEPNDVTVLSLVSGLLGLVALALCWLPATNRYAKGARAPR